MASLTDHITNTLKAIPDRKFRLSGDRKTALIVCPNPAHKGGHEEHPSFRINMVKSGKFWVGSGICFSCGLKVQNWKELYRYITGKVLVNYDTLTSEETVEKLFDDKLENELLDCNEHSEEFESIPWLASVNWRTISGKLLAAIGSKEIFDEKLKLNMLYLPCFVNGEEVGYIKARIKKQGKLNYFNKKGTWVHDLGLFPYDYTKRMIARRNLKILILVEGPRDALRCLQNGIPALAVLGSGNWSDMKAELVMQLVSKYNMDMILTCFDPDEAGIRVTKKVFASLKEEALVKRFVFPEGMDPGNMTKEYVTKLKSKVYKQKED